MRTQAFVCLSYYTTINNLQICINNFVQKVTMKVSIEVCVLPTSARPHPTTVIVFPSRLGRGLIGRQTFETPVLMWAADDSLKSAMSLAWPLLGLYCL